MEILIAVAVLLVLMLIGVPIALAFAGMVVALTIGLDLNPILLMNTAFRRLSEGIVLVALPLFILTGYLIESGGLARRLIAFVEMLVGRIKGGLGASMVISAGIFGAISGTATAAVAAIGTVMIDPLEKRGYPRNYSSVLLGISSLLGILFPPSITMILYAVVTRTNITDCFAATIGPGLLLVIGLIIANRCLCTRWFTERPLQPVTAPIAKAAAPAAPPPPAARRKRFFYTRLAIQLLAIANGVIFAFGLLEGRLSYFDVTTLIEFAPAEQQRAFVFAILASAVLGATVWTGPITKAALPALSLPVIILGGIYGGFVTPTEAAAVAAVAAILIGALIHRELTPRRFASNVLKAAETTGVITIILFFSLIIGDVLTSERVPQAAAAWMTETLVNPMLILLAINALLVVAGMIMDDVSVTVIFPPLLLPVVMSIGIDPVHFAAIVGASVVIGANSPPVAPILYMACKIGGTPIHLAIRPALVLMLFVALPVMLITTYIPSVALFIPELLGYEPVVTRP